MVCQACHEEMPFRMSDSHGSYFGAVPVIRLGRRANWRKTTSRSAPTARRCGGMLTGKLPRAFWRITATR